MEWFMNLSTEFEAFESQLRLFSAIAGVGLSIISLINFMSRLKNPHKENVSLFSLFVQQMFCIFLIDLDLVLGSGSASVFGESEASEVGNYITDMASTDVDVSFQAALLALATIAGRLFGLAAFISGYKAAGEANDMERKKLYAKAFWRYLAGVALVSFGSIYDMYDETYRPDFDVTSRGEFGILIETHVV